MKSKINEFMNISNVLGLLSLCLIAISTYGANTQCVAIFHDVQKPDALDSLKKY